jgi:16S rRNA (guanine527-N7)-methyltransferase
MVAQDVTVCDLGSGAGLPGLVLAIARPDLRITLVEPLLRRTTFLDEVVTELGLERVEVVRGRAESLHGQRRFGVVTSRAVAPLGRLLEWSMPLVAPTGALVAMKGSRVADEIEGAREVFTRGGCSEPEVHVLGEGVLASPTVVVRVTWADPGRVSWPLAVAPAGAPGSGMSSSRPSAKRRRGHDRRT